MRVTLALALALQFLPAVARAAPLAAEAPPPWKGALYVDGYVQPNEAAYLVPTVFADRGPLHLEARYNYEDFDTASLHVGWSFPFGDEERFIKLTPMLGGVVGNTKGVAPGAEVEARWGRLGYWLEAEYLVDLSDSSASYLYTWSELNFYALPWLWAGGSLQRLKALHSATEVDVGPMVGLGKPGAPGWSLSFYAYALTSSNPFYLATMAVQF